MALDYTNKRTVLRDLVSVLVPVLFWMAAHYVATVDSQYGPYQATTLRYGSAAYGGRGPYGQVPHSNPGQYSYGHQHSHQYANQYANPAQYDRHRRYYDPSNTQPCSNYFCFRLDFALLSVIRPMDVPAANATASGPCSTAQVFVCAADPVISGYSSYGYSGSNYAPPSYGTATNCPAFVCNANFTAIVTGCDRMNCTVIGSQSLMLF